MILFLRARSRTISTCYPNSFDIHSLFYFFFLFLDLLNLSSAHEPLISNKSIWNVGLQRLCYCAWNTRSAHALSFSLAGFLSSTVSCARSDKEYACRSLAKRIFSQQGRHSYDKQINSKTTQRLEATELITTYRPRCESARETKNTTHTHTPFPFHTKQMILISICKSSELVESLSSSCVRMLTDSKMMFT